MTTSVADQLTICNSALLKMGADPITSISGTSRAAVVCNTLYTSILKELLEAAPWRFALARVALTPNGTTPTFGYTYTYDVPTDCLRLLRMEDDKIEWVLEGSVILCDEATLNLQYIYLNDDESTWSFNFREAFSWRLAMELAICLTQSTTMKQEFEKSFKEQMALARSYNGVIGTIPGLEASAWPDARRGNAVWRRTAGQTT